MVYRFTTEPLVRFILEKGTATWFAYGQTGSGKSHTMGGKFLGESQNVRTGVYAFAARDIFLLLSQTKYKDLDLKVYMSFFEICVEKVYDLLDEGKKIKRVEKCKNQQIRILRLKTEQVTCPDDVCRMIEVGSAYRSSDSHTCLQIILRRKWWRGRIHGKISLVDLAGIERGADMTSPESITRMEGAEINSRLLALKECMRALGQKKFYSCFGESKITHILCDTFIEKNSQICMIATLSSGFNSCKYTLNTLRYANIVKMSPHSTEAAENQQMEPENGDESQSSLGGSEYSDNLSLKDKELSSYMSTLQVTMRRVENVQKPRELRKLRMSKPL
ncbi:kinesin-like protein KIF2C [Leptodactylus fuscus]